jgi:hypothetical protein
MILLHHPEVELSRNMLATLPQGCACVDWTDPAQVSAYGGPAPSAFPTVVVDVPAYAEDRPLFGADGEFLGLAAVTVPAHQEALRLPASWDAVASFVDSVQDRARLRPAV